MQGCWFCSGSQRSSSREAEALTLVTERQAERRDSIHDGGRHGARRVSTESNIKAKGTAARKSSRASDLMCCELIFWSSGGNLHRCGGRLLWAALELASGLGLVLGLEDFATYRVLIAACSWV